MCAGEIKQLELCEVCEIKQRLVLLGRKTELGLPGGTNGPGYALQNSTIKTGRERLSEVYKGIDKKCR